MLGDETSELERQESLRRAEADSPSSPVMRFGPDRPLALDSGAVMDQWQIAYQTYGSLNAARSNAVLICHALTGDQHVANIHPVTGKPGWWTLMVGPGRPIDTDRYFVICANVLGGCLGTTGPASVNPATGRPYGLDLPVLTIADMVRAQAALVDALGIDTLFAVVGGSMGAQVLDAEGIKALASMPSLDELRGTLIGLLNAPATKIAQLSTAPAAKLARVFGAYGAKEAA